MGSPVPFLIWLLCIGIAAIMIGIFIQDYEKEGFAASPSRGIGRNRQSNIKITTCPTGSASYITAAGNTNCCEGDLVNNVCNGNEICSLSPTITGGIQSCSDWITKEWTTRSRRFCTRSMPYYFGNLQRTPGLEGCSTSQSSSDGLTPQDSNAQKCKIYGNMTDELSKIDSCFNAKARDNIKCPQIDATKSMASYGTSTPVIFMCNYIPKDGSTNGMPTSCFDAPRIIEYIQSLTWISSGQKNEIISMIRSRRDSRFCNFSKAALGTGYMISGDGVPPTEVSIVLPVTKGVFYSPGNKALLTQYGNNVILAHIDKDNKVMNGRNGDMFIGIGKISDYKIDTYDNIWNVIGEMEKKAGNNNRSEYIKNMTVTRVY